MQEHEIPKQKAIYKERLKAQYIEDMIADAKEENKGTFVFDEIERFEISERYEYKITLKGEAVALWVGGYDPIIVIDNTEYKSYYNSVYKKPDEVMWKSKIKKHREIFKKISFKDWRKFYDFFFQLGTAVNNESMFETILDEYRGEDPKRQKE